MISFPYIDRFMRWKMAPDFLRWRLYPNAKEITESMGAYEAVRRNLWNKGFDPKDPSVTVVCVGDGRTPRTAFLFAVGTAWKSYSVDPTMKQPDRWTARWPRFVAIANRIERVAIEAERAVIVAVHSHAPMEAGWAAVNAPIKAGVAIPCCVPQRLDFAPFREYDDKNILSPARRVAVWLKKDGAK